MTRPSANLDKKMLDAGLKIIIKEGVEGLTARNICKYAGVNLGMFNYYFKSKDYYITLLFTGLHGKLMDFINIDSVKDKNSIERLKYVLIKMFEYSKKYSKISVAMLGDVLGSYKTYKTYVENGTIPHQEILVDIIEEAKKDGYLKKEIRTMDIFSLLIFGGLMPEFFKDALNDKAKFLKLDKNEYLGEDSTKTRVDIILKELER